MRPRLLVFFLVFSSVAFAQHSELRVEPASVVKDVVVDDLRKAYQDITPITVTNDARRTIQLVREQVIIGKPDSWKYGTFSRRNRVSPYVITGTENEQEGPVNLGPGESATFYVVLQPDGGTGDGRVEVRFSDLTVPGRVLGKAVVTSEITQRSGIGTNTSSGSNLPDLSSRPAPTSVRIFPNPARERFFVEAPAGVRIGRVEIRNTLGSMLKKFDKPAGKDGYEVENLPDGLYMISIYDDRGKKLKTLRLLHRQFGA
jgi:hypothetical protein